MTMTPMCRLPAFAVIVLAFMATACGDDSATNVGSAPGSGPYPTTGPYPIVDLTFAIHPDGIDGPGTTYRLTCGGDTATFTGESATLDAPDACLALTDEAVRSLLVDGSPGDRVCTEIYGGPRVARISGTLDEVQIDTIIDRVNGCAITDYDVLLAALLAPAG